MIDNMITYSIQTLVLFAEWLVNTPAALLFVVFGIVAYIFSIVMRLCQ